MIDKTTGHNGRQHPHHLRRGFCASMNIENSHNGRQHPHHLRLPRRFPPLVSESQRAPAPTPSAPKDCVPSWSAVSQRAPAPTPSAPTGSGYWTLSGRSQRAPAPTPSAPRGRVPGASREVTTGASTHTICAGNGDTSPPPLSHNGRQHPHHLRRWSLVGETLLRHNGRQHPHHLRLCQK